MLFNFDPESVHDFFTSAGESLGSHGFTRGVVDAIYGYHGPDISKTVDGITYRTPFVLSAGFDYNGHLSRVLPHIGLGGEEIGSVTARPCEGNHKPRLVRLPQSRSILVNKGLKNDGVDAVIRRLKSVPRDPGFVLGVSIARTNCRETAHADDGVADYVHSFKHLNEAGIGDYYTINISCPNAYGGETFAHPERLPELLSALRAVPCKRPVYVKMPINLPWAEFSTLLNIIDTYGLQGVVIGNLNKDYGSLDVREEAPTQYRGGLSGKPCTHPSTELVRKTREMYGKRFTIIGCGGVMSPATAMEKFDAGADLVQLVSGLIFEGPGLVKRMCAAVASQKRPA